MRSVQESICIFIFKQSGSATLVLTLSHFATSNDSTGFTLSRFLDCPEQLPFLHVELADYGSMLPALIPSCLPSATSYL